jgi:HSP20 family molecular chaperone IbpA
VANGGSIALDKLILNKQEDIHRTRRAKGVELNSELNRFFDELISSQEKDLKRMTDLRSKLFPEISKKKAEKDGYLSDDIARELKKVEEEIYTIARKFQARISERESQEEGPLKIELEDQKKCYDIRVEVPGVAREDIKVNLNGNTVTLEASRKEEIRTKKSKMDISEFSYGEFKRVIELPERVKADSMKVEYKNGVVNIRIDKV